MSIEKNGYKATEAQVEELARNHQIGSAQAGQANVTYLRIILAATQAVLGRRGRKPSDEKQREVLQMTHEQYYPAVLRGVGGEGVEAQRRGTFARTAKSTLASYVQRGGDLRKLDLQEATKNGITRLLKPAEPEDKTERTLQRASGTIARAIRRQARGDPEQAQKLLESVVEALREQVEPAARVIGTQLRRRRVREHEVRAS